MRGLGIALLSLMTASALLFLGPVPSARAQDFDLTVSPVKKELTLGPGEGMDFEITLINHADREQELLVYTMDFFINPDNSYDFQEPGYYTYSCSQWITILRSRFTVPARSLHEEPFRLQVPADAEPGGHFSVLFFQDAAEPAPGQGVKPTYRIGSLILVTVAGEIVREANVKALSVESDFFSLWGPPGGGEAGWPARDIRYHLEVENVGNVHLTVQASLSYRSKFGFGSGSVDLGEITMLPGTVRYFDGSLPSPPFLGIYEAEAVIRYGPQMNVFDTEKHGKSGFWVVPLPWIFFLILIGVGAWCLVHRLRRR